MKSLDAGTVDPTPVVPLRGGQVLEALELHDLAATFEPGRLARNATNC
ncbi:MAG: hypothetical protein JRH11_08510 [Deltaproteobacteria bacterium]|nr:hypothetical protein [Deltaproteobacteria bacterium]